MMKTKTKNYFFFEMGCLTRQVENLSVLRYLELNSWKKTDLPEADLIVVSTCAVTQEQIQRSLQNISTLESGKSKHAITVVTGCLPGIDLQSLRKVYSGTVVSPYSLHDLDTLLNSKVSFKTMELSLKYDRICEGSNTIAGARVIRINYGCGHTCSFCGIRNVYPKIKSQSMEWVLQQIRIAEKENAPEICLVSEDLTAFGKDQGHDFCELLREILKESYNGKIALPRMHPDYVLAHQEFFFELFETGRVSVIGFVVNSGSEKVLKLMRRHYDVEAARRFIFKVKEISPATIIRSDFLIGHPGEAEEDFLLSLRFFCETPIDIVAVSRFSLIPNTPAEKLSDHVSQDIIEQRYVRFHFARAFTTDNSLTRAIGPLRALK